MTKPGTNPGAGDQPEPGKEPTGIKPEDVDNKIQAALAKASESEIERITAIKGLAEKADLGAEWVLDQIVSKTTIEAAREMVLDTLTERQKDQGPSWIPGGAQVTADERDKFVAGATAWLIQKAGKAQAYEAHSGEKLDAGEFRGLTLLDLARESVLRAGGSPRGMDKMALAGAALNRAGYGASLNTRSDFPVLLENVLHKMLQAAYGTTPDTWRMFCAQGSVSDFREHKRLRLGSLSVLDALNEAGEYTQKHMPDAEKEGITASTFGNIVGLSRQAIVNDDVDGFSRLITMLGRAAARSIEVDVYELLAENSGLGPTMGDGNTLFHADHDNIGSGQALAAAAIDDDRVLMAQQQDPDGNDFLDLRPDTLVVPIGLGSTARQINESVFDPDVDGATKPNTVNGLFNNIVDTPRLTGTRRYLFADPNIAPVLEVVFLDGQSSPVIETEEGFDYDGVRWRVRFDYGVGATDFRGAVTDAGA